jgi:hypothetical protein
VDESVELLADGGDHARRAMSGILHADTAGEIEEAIAVHVFQDGAFGARRENRRGVSYAARHSGLSAAH